MSRTPRIRLSTKDRSEYARLVKNAKSKISRTQKRYDVDLTGSVSMPDINFIQTREQFNQLKQDLSSFLNRNNTTYQFRKNKYGVVASVREINATKRNNSIAREKAEREMKRLKKMPFYINGEQKGTLGERMMVVKPSTVAGVGIPAKFDFNQIRTPARMKQVQKQSKEKAKRDYYDKRIQIMKMNWILKAREVLNNAGDDLVNKVKKMDDAHFYDMYLMHENLHFKYMYQAEAGEIDDYAAELVDIVDDYLESYGDSDLWMF